MITAVPNVEPPTKVEPTGPTVSFPVGENTLIELAKLERNARQYAEDMKGVPVQQYEGAGAPGIK